MKQNYRYKSFLFSVFRAKNILVIIFSILFLSSFSQKKETAILKTSLSSPINVYGGNIYLGLEMPSFFKNKSMEFGAAVFIPTRERRGIKLNAEIKHYFKHKKGEKPYYNSFYFADEIWLRIEEYKKYDVFCYYNAEHYCIDYYDYELLNRQEIRNNIKVGYQSVFFTRVVLDIYLGLGINYHFTQFQKKINDSKSFCNGIVLFEQPINTGFGWDIILGIKLGYVLKKGETPLPTASF